MMQNPKCEIRGEHCTGAVFLFCPRCGCRACTACLGRLLLLPCGEHRETRTSEEFVTKAFPDLDLGDIDSAVKALTAQVDEKLEDFFSASRTGLDEPEKADREKSEAPAT